MSGLKQFRTIPKDIREWSRWMKDQSAVPSKPTAGNYKITNMYIDADTDEIVIEFDEIPT